jgi:hypothetical protein
MHRSGAVWIEPDRVIHGILKPLLAAQIPLCGFDGNMSQEKLNLLELALPNKWNKIANFWATTRTFWASRTCRRQHRGCRMDRPAASQGYCTSGLRTGAGFAPRGDLRGSASAFRLRRASECE